MNTYNVRKQKRALSLLFVWGGVGPYFVKQCFMCFFSFANISLRERERERERDVALLLLVLSSWCHLAFPHGAAV